MNPGSNRNIASRKLGSSFQNAHPTSAKSLRRRISAACASVGALESGFTVEPWATIKSALSSGFTEENVQQPALSASRTGPPLKQRQLVVVAVPATKFTAGKQSDDFQVVRHGGRRHCRGTARLSIRKE